MSSNTETKTPATKTKRPAAIEIGKTQSGKRVSSTSTRFQAVFTAVTRKDYAMAKKALRRALPEYTSQDYLDAATIYARLTVAGNDHDWMVNLCREVAVEVQTEAEATQALAVLG